MPELGLSDNEYEIKLSLARALRERTGRRGRRPAPPPGADGLGRPRAAHLHHFLSCGDGGGPARRPRAGPAGHRCGRLGGGLLDYPPGWIPDREGRWMPLAWSSSRAWACLCPWWPSISAARSTRRRRYDREQALRETQQQKEFLASVLERASQPFAVGYPDGRLGLFNRAFVELTGYTAEELRSMDWTKTLTPPEWLEPRTPKARGTPPHRPAGTLREGIPPQGWPPGAHRAAGSPGPGCAGQARILLLLCHGH